jgi:hypothetical protein
MRASSSIVERLVVVNCDQPCPALLAESTL